MFYHLFLLLSLVSTGCANVPWQAVDQLLRDAVEERVFPGAVALVADEGGVLYKTAVGSLTYGQKTPMGRPIRPVRRAPYLIWPAVQKLLQLPAPSPCCFKATILERRLANKVGSVLGTEYNINGKTNNIENCLLHHLGFPPGSIA